ncbi:MAG: hypothetical protein M0015_03455 [Betaproteobacteria bacterium]|nr:hypothetical protein [Betaproteobacteria bacterium]
MAEYPAELARTHRLADGTMVMIRPMRATDADLTCELLAGLRVVKRLRAPALRRGA